MENNQNNNRPLFTPTCPLFTLSTNILYLINDLPSRALEFKYFSVSSGEFAWTLSFLQHTRGYETMKFLRASCLTFKLYATFNSSSLELLIKNHPQRENDDSNDSATDERVETHSRL